MPAFSRDLKRTLSKAITIADNAAEAPLRITHSTVYGTSPHRQAAAATAAVAKLAREHPLLCVMTPREV